MRRSFGFVTVRLHQKANFQTQTLNYSSVYQGFHAKFEHDEQPLLIVTWPQVMCSAPNARLAEDYCRCEES